MISEKLILGTANFGNPYSTTKDKGGVSERECNAILNLAWDMGIRCLDTAVTYGGSLSIIGKNDHTWTIFHKCDSLLDGKDIFKYSCVVHFLKHHETADWCEAYDGVSVYSVFPGYETFPKIVQAPVNIFDNRFVRIKHAGTLIARSIFMQGQAWQMPDIMGIPFAHLCWNFVMNHPNIDKIVFGVDNIEQLYAILNIPEYEIDYSKIGTGEKWIK